MKVLILSQYLALGGLERMIVSLAQKLTLLNVDCQVVTYERAGLCDHLLQSLERSGIRTTTLQKRSGFCLRTILTIRKIVLNEKVQVIHTHDLGALIYGVCAALSCLMRVKVVHTQHSFIHLRKGKKRYTSYERIFCKAAAKICTVSTAIEQKYKSLGIRSNKLKFLPNGIEFTQTFVDKITARGALGEGLPAEKFIIQKHMLAKNWLLSLGRIVPGKGVERLLLLWGELPVSIRTRWMLVIVGPVDKIFLTERVQPILQNNDQLLNSVLFVGQTHQPSDWYFASDAYVSLSEEEGMPLSVCEAIGRAMPIILTDIDGHRELAPYAHFIPQTPGHTDALKLEQFIVDTERTEDQRADVWLRREEFREKHSTQKMAKDYRHVYSSALTITRQSAMGLISLLLNLFLLSSASAWSSQRLTMTLEKPEYLLNDDFGDHFSLSLAPGENRLLILENNDFCGPLPQMQGTSQEAPVQLKWYLGRTINLKNPSFEGALPGSYVDALVPLDQSLDCRHPDLQNARWLFADLSVGDGASAGRRSLEIVSRMQPRQGLINSEVQPQRWTVSLRILPVRLHEPWALPLSAEFTPYFASLAHFGRSDSREGELTRKYVRAMIEHRILPLKAWIRHPFKKATEQSDREFLLTRDPTPQMSFSNTVVSELPWWAEIDVPRIDSADPEERHKYWSRWQEFFDSPSPDPNEALFQQRISQRPFVYLWDEPQREDYQTLRDVSESLRLGAPAISALVTIYPWPSLLDSIQIFSPLLQTLEREGPPALTPGHQLWSYVSCMSHGCGSEHSSGEPDFVIERNAAYIRVWPWMAEHYNLQRILYYSVNNGWRKSLSVDPWDNLWDFSGNGDGTLFYPGRKGRFGLTTDTAIPSLRMKLWRQSSFDAEYISFAKEDDKHCLSKIKNQITLAETAFRWNRDSRIYDKAREQLIDCLFPSPIGADAPQVNP